MAIFLSPDPLEADPRVLLDRDEEEAREQRWAEFVQAWRDECSVPPWRETINVPLSIRCLNEALNNPARDDGWMRQIRAFADSEGWVGVLSALARALKAQGS